MTIEVIGSDTVASSNAASVRSTQTDSLTSFSDTLALVSGSMTPALSESLKYGVGDSAASIAWVTGNATYGTSAALGSSSTSFSGLSGYSASNYLTGNPYASTSYTTKSGDSISGFDSSDPYSAVSDLQSTSTENIILQAYVGQVTTSQTTLSNLIAASDDTKRKIIQNMHA